MGEAEEPKLSDVLADRREKLERLREAGIDPFPPEFADREEIGEVRAAHKGLAPGIETESRHRVAGRLVGRRGHGKACFLDLRDATGQIQLHAREDLLGEEPYKVLVDLDLGDIIGVEGTALATRRGGELSLAIDHWRLLAKSLRPPPDKFHGLEDVETRYRQRELDLIANEESRRCLRPARSHGQRGAPLARRTRFRRGRDAGPAAALRRRPGAALHHPPQRARPRPLPAHRHRALPEAAGRRRHRQGLRARQGLPQRGDLAQAQPRVHDARVVRGLRRLRSRPRTGSRRWSPRSPSACSARPWSSATASRSTSPRPGSGSASARRSANAAASTSPSTRPARRWPRRSGPSRTPRRAGASWSTVCSQSTSSRELIQPTFVTRLPG